MKELMVTLVEFNLVSVSFRLLLAAVLSGIVGLERESHGRIAGFRTHILVGIGAAMASMVGIYSTVVLGYATDPLRVGAQVMSGIGFLGAGTILVKNTAKVKGLTTAAGLWCMAAIGLSCGIGFYSGAIVGSLLSIVVVALPTKVENRWPKKHKFYNLYVEVYGLEAVNPLIDTLDSGIYHLLGLEIHSARSAIPGMVGLQLLLRISNDASEEENIHMLLQLEGVRVVLLLK